MSRNGILLVNLGSPDSPAVSDVRKYLREFLMDGRVMDVPYALRFAIVHGLILPFRPRASAALYRKIWTANGSPLVEGSRGLQRKLEKTTGLPVALAMRYGNPAIAPALEALTSAGVEDVLVVPLFPHYAMSSYESAVERVKEVAAQMDPGLRLSVLPPYYDRPEYIRALAETALPYLEKNHDHLLFSFHGIPERHLLRANPACRGCLDRQDECSGGEVAERTCYRRHCLEPSGNSQQFPACGEERSVCRFNRG
jgi:ferrochelatase